MFPPGDGSLDPRVHHRRWLNRVAAKMRIHAISTGSVRLKHSFLFASAGARR
jgi:hypothetical protein